MKKIAYVEIDTHAEIAGNFMELMRVSQDFQVDYYFSARILQLLKLEESEHVFCVTAQELFSILKAKNVQMAYDFVIIGTVHRYFNVFLKIAQSFNTGILVHNKNFVKLSSFELFQNIFKKDLIFRMKLLLREGLLQKVKVHQSAKIHFFLEAKENKKESFNYLPLFYSMPEKNKGHSKNTIVIPGNVSQQRRDYRGVLVKLEQWSSAFEQKNAGKNLFNEAQVLEIVFLGKAAGKELKWLQDFELKGVRHLKIIYFKEKVPQPVFDEWMQKAVFFCCPLQKETEFFSNTEIYGETKISGITGDALRYRKIAFLPEFYESGLPFIKKDPEDLESLMELFKTFENINYFQEYDFKTVSRQLAAVLKKLI